MFPNIYQPLRAYQRGGSASSGRRKVYDQLIYRRYLILLTHYYLEDLVIRESSHRFNRYRLLALSPPFACLPPFLLPIFIFL